MPEHIQYEDDDLFNPETHHESSDVPVRPLFWFIVLFIVFAVVTHFAVLLLFRGFERGEQKRMDPPATAVARPDDASVPKNQPLLQPFPREIEEGKVVPPQANTPVVDLIEMRAAEDRVLKSYGWVDRERGIVRMPIQQAKELLAARIAVRGATAPGSTPDTGVTPPATTNTAGGTQQ